MVPVPVDPLHEDCTSKISHIACSVRMRCVVCGVPGLACRSEILSLNIPRLYYILVHAKSGAPRGSRRGRALGVRGLARWRRGWLAGQGGARARGEAPRLVAAVK